MRAVRALGTPVCLTDFDTTNIPAVSYHFQTRLVATANIACQWLTAPYHTAHHHHRHHRDRLPGQPPLGGSLPKQLPTHNAVRSSCWFKARSILTPLLCVPHRALRCKYSLLKSNKRAIARRSAVQFNLLHRHVSVTLVTNFRVSYSKDTSNTLVIT
jgi:hypothetical protein